MGLKIFIYEHASLLIRLTGSVIVDGARTPNCGMNLLRRGFPRSLHVVLIMRQGCWIRSVRDKAMN